MSVAAALAGATVSLPRSLAAELAPIRVNAVALGMIKTWDDSELDERMRSYIEQQATALPLRRPGTANGAAEGYLYAMTNPSEEGTVLHVNGGATRG